MLFEIRSKARVNYSRDQMDIPFEEAVELASLDDDDRRLKLSHHPDGFVQFSGEGVLSGRDPNGAARGMGVMSWPLAAPVRGACLRDGHPRYRTLSGGG